MKIEDLPPLTNIQIRTSLAKVAINSAQALNTIKNIISDSGVDISDENKNILKMNHDRLIELCKDLLGLSEDE